MAEHSVFALQQVDVALRTIQTHIRLASSVPLYTHIEGNFCSLTAQLSQSLTVFKPLTSHPLTHQVDQNRDITCTDIMES